ncbi:MAG: hypothetical protein QG622_633 [Actinomycetota bacterium]|nr:hypothetical protein [Actinomycetota bacterium]
MRHRAMALLAATAVTASAGAALVGLSTVASAASCAPAWSASAVYTAGMSASFQGRNYGAKWWTQNESPAVNTTDVWADRGACSGSTGPGGPVGSGTSSSSSSSTTSSTRSDPGGSGGSGGFVVSEGQFEQMFPGRNSFYTYSGLVTALKAYPAFAGTGGDTVKKQEAAAFLANINHETGGLVHVVEQNTANYSHYCDSGQSYGCPAGQSAYYGRGPIQLSWNFNYKAAGDALGVDLLHNPGLVQTDAAVAWKTGIWYWMTSTGPGTMTPHAAMVDGAGFGETIRSINGSLECGGRNPAQVQSRVAAYERFAGILGVPAGEKLSC